jgi:Ferritin-like domain
MKQENALPNGKNRRGFLKGALTAGAAVAGTSALSAPNLLAQGRGRLTRGDAAILKFLAAAELIEADLWQQYAELGGVTTGTQNGYQNALQQLDGDVSQYITSNTLDEQSHAQFLNAYLVMRGQQAVNFDQFRTLPGSQATGSAQIKRLTNLTQLSVDTSWYTRYSSSTSPDFGATFVQAIPQLANGVFSAIPITDADFGPTDHAQALANTAAFHFGFIEQGGASLYATLGQLVSEAEVLRVVLSIGGDEVAHFLEWVDFAGNAVQTPLAPLTDPNTGLLFPDFNATGNPLLQTNLIFPVPCEFISASLPHCAVIRPTGQDQINAVTFTNALTADGLFIGQSPSFIQLLVEMADAADEAGCGL